MFADAFEERLDYLQQRLTPQIRQKIRAKAALERNTIAFNTVNCFRIDSDLSKIVKKVVHD
jgi:hypothetical protein